MGVASKRNGLYNEGEIKTLIHSEHEQTSLLEVNLFSSASTMAFSTFVFFSLYWGGDGRGRGGAVPGENHRPQPCGQVLHTDSVPRRDSH